MPGNLSTRRTWEVGADTEPREHLDTVALIDFAMSRGHNDGYAIRRRFGCSVIRYAQELNRAIDMPEAMLERPELTVALREAREARRIKRHGQCSLCGGSLGRPWDGKARCTGCGQDGIVETREEAK